MDYMGMPMLRLQLVGGDMDGAREAHQRELIWKKKVSRGVNL